MLRMLSKISVWYYLGLLTWLGIYSLRKFNIIIPFVNNHLTDLYSVPMFCYTIQFVMSEIFKRERKQSFSDIMFSASYLSLLFEVICPRLSPIYTADVSDAICYFVGGFVYYVVLHFNSFRKTMIRS